VREFTSGEVLRTPMAKDQPVKIREIVADYANDLTLQRLIEDRGVARAPAQPDPVILAAAS